MNFKVKKRPVDLFVVFIILIVLILLITSVSTLINMRKIMKTSSESYVNLVSETVFSKTRGYLKPVALLNNMIIDVNAVNAQFLDQLDYMNHLGSSFLLAYPQLQSFIIGNKVGEFYLLRNNLDSTYTLRVIDPNNPTHKTVNSILDANMQPITTTSANTLDFDPRVRPWYIGASKSRGNFWTPLYIFYMDNQPGLTISQSYNDEKGMIAGAFGFDINLYGLSEFLKTLDLSTNGKVMIINDQNQIVAYSHPELIFDASLSFNETDFDAFKDKSFATCLELGNVSPGIKNFTVNGTSYIGNVRSLESEIGVPWKIIIVYPIQDFLDPYRLTLYFVISSTFFAIILLTSLLAYRHRELKATHQLIYFANHDNLTQLYNRHYFSVQYQQTLFKSSNGYSLVLSDIDRFKYINDQYGHAVGDQVLIQIASIIRKKMGMQQDAFRWGGEEFLFVLENQDLEKAIAFAEMLRVEISKQVFIIDDLKLQITMSFGVSTCKDNCHFKETVAHADENLYKAKANGRNCVVS